MSRSCGLAVPVLLLVLAATATAAIKPLEEAPQDDKPVDHLASDAHSLLPQKEEPDARIASAEAWSEPAAARVASVETSSEPAARLEEKKDGGGDAAMPMEAVKPSGVAIQGGDPGMVPKAGSGDGSGNGNSNDSGEHGKGESGNSGGGSSSSKEAEKSATKSCLTKEECHKKRLLCGKGCTLSAHAKCAAKCSKSCIPTC